jgi:RimJ/RimL family protein N-acetyltransferase
VSPNLWWYPTEVPQPEPVFQQLKCNTDRESRYKGLSLDQFEYPGFSLTPVGPWILDDDALIAKLEAWRELNKYSFFFIFDKNRDSLRDYIESHSIIDDKTILFLIENQFNESVGHIGLSKLKTQSVHLDNVLKSPQCPNGLMEIAIRRLVHWVFSELKLNSIELEVREDNLGFKSSGFFGNTYEVQTAKHHDNLLIFGKVTPKILMTLTPSQVYE